MEKNTIYTQKIYDRFAETYHTSMKAGRFYNKYIELPAAKKMVGSVKGKHVLDMGCGSGYHTEHFLALGARVTGCDISGEMLKIAALKNPKAEFVKADMKALPFKKDVFDVVFSGLAVHYVKDLKTVFKEVRRVLRPGGRFVFSTMNPVITGSRLTDFKNGRKFVIHDYFGCKEEAWDMVPGMRIRNYIRTIAELFNPLMEAGFSLIRVNEPRPIPASRKIDPGRYKLASQSPSFIIIEARKNGA